MKKRNEWGGEEKRPEMKGRAGICDAYVHASAVPCHHGVIRVQRE
jgi:hypothetical protein